MKKMYDRSNFDRKLILENGAVFYGKGFGCTDDRIVEIVFNTSPVGYQEIEKQTVPEGCVFVLGDNRAVSIDSRNEAVGPIPLYRVVGKVRSVIYPFGSFRTP